ATHPVHDSSPGCVCQVPTPLTPRGRKGSVPVPGAPVGPIIARAARDLYNATAERRNAMIPGHLFPVLVAVSVCVGAAEPAAQKVEAQAEGDAVHVLVDGRLFTSYKHEASQKYPYLWPVAGPLSGESVTTES